MFKDKARTRHALKVALAVVLTYWFALQLDWLNPYWALLAVSLCSLATRGESLLQIASVAGYWINTGSGQDSAGIV